MTRRVLPGGQVALPREMQVKLRLKEGDYLEAEVVDGSLLLRPVADVEREQAWRRVLDAPKSVRYVGHEPRPSPEEEEEWLAGGGEGRAARRLCQAPSLTPRCSSAAFSPRKVPPERSSNRPRQELSRSVWLRRLSMSCAAGFYTGARYGEATAIPTRGCIGTARISRP